MKSTSIVPVFNKLRCYKTKTCLRNEEKVLELAAKVSKLLAFPQHPPKKNNSYRPVHPLK